MAPLRNWYRNDLASGHENARPNVFGGFSEGVSIETMSGTGVVGTGILGMNANIFATGIVGASPGILGAATGTGIYGTGIVGTSPGILGTVTGTGIYGTSVQASGTGILGAVTGTGIYGTSVHASGALSWSTASSPSLFSVDHYISTWNRSALQPLNLTMTSPFVRSWLSQFYADAKREAEREASRSEQPVYSDRILSWKDRLIEEIGEYAFRPEGWDGYSARPINHQSIEDAQQFISSLPDHIEPPRDQPCSDGEVSLIWRDGERFAEIGFPGNGTFYWYATDGERRDGDDDVPIRRGLPLHLQDIMGMRHLAQGKPTSSFPPLRSYGAILLAA